MPLQDRLHPKIDPSSTNHPVERALGVSEAKEGHFTSDQIIQITSLFKILEKIYYRLMAEGYVIYDGKILPPA